MADEKPIHYADTFNDTLGSAVLAGADETLKPISSKATRLRHGHARHDGQSKASPTYHSWLAMKTRCRNPKRDNADRYFSRGITFCERWSTFDNFLADMGERPLSTTLDRIDVSKGYEPGNCRWATPTEQARNTRHTILTFDKAVEIARRRLSGEACRSIAADYGISESLPREIAKGRVWKGALDAARK
jgi:hypothetical protein